ncbi:MAG: lipocalin family protein [Woeseiaceae bacterium]|nr:lipocalin family protein [Woeseiaceae bacterium]
MARKFRFRQLLPLSFCALSGGCTGMPDGITPITGFELDRYLGTWYEVARLDHRFERGLSQVTASYSVREEGGVQVVNRGFNAAKGEWNEAEGKAFFVDEPDVGRLKVSFFGPFYGAYNIIELDKDDYQYSMITGPNRSYLWILARQPELDPKTLERLIAKASELGFATDELIFVEHD